jgi:hypothetical protein
MLERQSAATRRFADLPIAELPNLLERQFAATKRNGSEPLCQCG